MLLNMKEKQFTFSVSINIVKPFIESNFSLPLSDFPVLLKADLIFNNF